jgi:hypothetical protein
MPVRVMILNGPNLNLLGVREPHIYGTTTLAAIETTSREFGEEIGAPVVFHQSNHEGVLIDWVHARGGRCDHHQSGRLHLHLGRSARCAEDVRRADHRAAHLQHSPPGGDLSPVEDLAGGQGRDLRPRGVRLRRRAAVRRAHARCPARQPAGAVAGRATLTCRSTVRSRSGSAAGRGWQHCRPPWRSRSPRLGRRSGLVRSTD